MLAHAASLPPPPRQPAGAEQLSEELLAAYEAAKALDVWLVAKAAEDARQDARTDYRFYMDSLAAKLDIAIQRVEDARRDKPAPAAPRPSPSPPGWEAAREALQKAETALNDWLVTYAGDCCSEEACEETRKRISDLGTLGYITSVQETISVALRSLPAPSLSRKEETMREAIEDFVALERQVAMDIASAHSARADAASEWMREEDSLLRQQWRAAVEKGRAAIAGKG